MDNQFIRYFSGLGTGTNPSLARYAVKETVLNGFFTIDKNWIIQYANSVAEKLFDVLPGAAVGKHLHNELGAVIPPEIYAIIQGGVLKESPEHFEEYSQVMGTWFDVILYFCDDLISISYKSVHPAANLEDTQQQLLDLNGLYHEVTGLTSDCLWEWALEKKAIFWIEGGHKRVFGYQIENALLPQSFWENKIHPEDRTRVLESLNNIDISDPNGMWEQEYRFRRADGTYAYIRDRGRVMFTNNTGGLRMGGTTEDISALTLVQLELAAEREKKSRTMPASRGQLQEKERLSIANDLYKNVSHTLCAAKMYVDFALKNDDERQACLKMTSDCLLSVVNEIRNICKKLTMPDMINGLFESVRTTIIKKNSTGTVRLELNVNDLKESDLDERLQFDLFRIIQELTDNIIIHAQATRGWVDISQNRNEITLLVSDNGKGCDLSKEAMGLGIIQVLSSADLYEGRIQRISTPGNGYIFKVMLPIDRRSPYFSSLLSDYDA